MWRGFVSSTALLVPVAFLCGAAWGTCFGRRGAVLLPWVVLAPLLLLLGHRRASLLAWAHGLGAWLVSLSWIVPTLRTYGDLPWLLAASLSFLLAAYLALFHWGFALGGAGLWHRGGAAAWLGLPALWVALEWLRTHLLTGFPWNLAAYAWVEFPGVLALSSWVGSFGLTFLLVFSNTGVALAAIQRRWEPLALGLLAPLLICALASRFGSPPAPAPGLASVPVRILQPNIPNLTAWDQDRVLANYQKVLRLSRQGCDEEGALVLWPESAAWPFALDRDETLGRDVARLVARGCPVLLNSSRLESGRAFNSALLVGREGRVDGYDKLHLVPFGEYVPLRRLLPFVGKLARNAGDYSPGEQLTLLPWEGDSIGVSICFEVIFPGEVAARVSSGASILVTLTNDAWYGDTWAPWQHFRAARFRAAENARPLLRAAITGVSAVIRPDGSVEDLLGVGREGIIRAQVTGRRDLTFYTRFPWLVPVACALTAVFAIFWVKGVQRWSFQKSSKN